MIKAFKSFTLILSLFSFTLIYPNHIFGVQKHFSKASMLTKSDSLQLLMLIRKVYSWAGLNSDIDFTPSIKRDTIFIGIDWTAQKKAIKQFKDSKLFDNEFINNLQRIAEYQDSVMRYGKEKWDARYIPCFPIADASPWCECQDDFAFTAAIGIIDLNIIKGKASFKWKVINNSNPYLNGFVYDVRAKKEKGIWKISYLKGFDFKNYIM